MKTATPLVGRCWQGMGRVAVAFVMWCVSSTALAGETITFFHNDVAGSPALATDVNGIQAWKETYRPYGDQLIDSSAAQNNKLWFTGKSFDDSTGLSYMGARYYDPTLGRFMAVDPVSFDLGNLHSFNRYTYANNNPYKYVDPDGEFAIPVAIRGGMLLLAAGCAVIESCRNTFANADWRPLITPLQPPLQDPLMWSEEKKDPGKPQVKEAETSDPSEGGSSPSSAPDTSRRPAPFLPDDPYSPESTSGRQSETRRQEGAPSLDPDSPIPDRGSGRDLGGHPARGRTPHETRERNVNPNEEHSRRPKRDPGNPRRN